MTSLCIFLKRNFIIYDNIVIIPALLQFLCNLFLNGASWRLIEFLLINDTYIKVWRKLWYSYRACFLFLFISVICALLCTPMACSQSPIYYSKLDGKTNENLEGIYFSRSRFYLKKRRYLKVSFAYQVVKYRLRIGSFLPKQARDWYHITNASYW